MTLKELGGKKVLGLVPQKVNMKQVPGSAVGFGVLFLRRKAAPDCKASSRLSITPVSSPSVKREAGNPISPQVTREMSEHRQKLVTVQKKKNTCQEKASISKL